MAIKVGQIRKNANQNYITGIAHSLTTFSVSGISGNTFSEFAISGNFQAGVPYYIRVLINRLSIKENMGSTLGAGDNDPHNLNIDIKLYPDANENSTYQTIGEPLLIEPYVPQSDSGTDSEGEQAFFNWCEACISDRNPPISNYPGASDYYAVLKAMYDAQQNDEDRDSNITTPYQTVELVFTPYVNSTYLVFQLRRITYDYTIAARTISIVDGNNNRDVATINNILTKESVNKIGIQSRPGSLVAINQEPMRIGKSGTLEINNGLLITSVGMIAPSNNINEFILDYTYNV